MQQLQIFKTVLNKCLSDYKEYNYSTKRKVSKEVFTAAKIYVPDVCIFCTFLATQKVACHFRRRALPKHTQNNLKHELA